MTNIFYILSKVEITCDEKEQLIQHFKEAQILFSELIEYVENNRVIPQILHNLKIVQQNVSNRSLDVSIKVLQPLLDDILDNYEKMISTVECINGKNNFLNKVILFKGIYSSSLYPKESFRELWDIDIFVPTFKEGLNLSKSLEQENFICEGASWVRKMRFKDLLIGTAHWIEPVNDVTFDLHYQNLSIGVTEDMYLNPEKTMDIKVGNQIGKTFNIEDTFLIIVAHIESHGTITFRDINDIYILVKNFGDDLNWKNLIQQHKKHGLESSLYILLGVCKSIYINLHLPNIIEDKINEVKIEKYQKKILKKLPYKYSKGKVLSHFWNYECQNSYIFKRIINLNKKILSCGWRKIIEYHNSNDNKIFDSFIEFYNKKQISVSDFSGTIPLFFVRLQDLGIEINNYEDFWNWTNKNSYGLIKYQKIDEDTFLFNLKNQVSVVVHPYGIFMPVRLPIIKKEQVNILSQWAEKVKNTTDNTLIK